MEHTSKSSSFTTTQFIISFLSTALILMSIIYWVSGCHTIDYSNDKNAEQPAAHHENAHE